MKKTYTLFAAVLFSATLFIAGEANAQAPQKMSYQAVIRDASNTLVVNHAVGMKISILQGTTPVYVETQVPVANANGLVTLEIGAGTVVSGSFSTINQASGSYAVKTETDPTGGTNYSIVGTSKLTSVPYALFSANGPTGPAGPQGPQGIQGQTGPAGNTGATGLQGPTGLTGATGPQGPIGLTGLTGATGPQGPIGLTGPAGAAGAKGATGATGATGPQGPIGLTGATGPHGSIGLTGATGPQGATGLTGVQGPAGPTGPSGILSPGSSAGNTPYWNGSAWVTNSSNIYNNGAFIGIGTTSPRAPLSFAGTLGDKIALWDDGNAAGNNYGIGVQSGLLQIHSDAAVANIAFGYGKSTSFTERMRIITGSGYDGMSLNGRLILRNGSTDLTGGGGGVWLTKADNSALLGFMGTQNNKNIGFYGGPAGWGFTYDAINSRVGIGNENPLAPLSFGASEGKKIVLYPGPTGDYGFGISNSRLRIFSENTGADVAIGSDVAGIFTERLAIKGNGALAVSGSTGTAGQVLQSGGSGVAPKWATKPYYMSFRPAGDQSGYTYLTGAGVKSIPIPDIDNLSFFIAEASRVQVNVSANLTPTVPDGTASGSMYIELWESSTNTLKLQLSASGYVQHYDGATLNNMDIVDLNPGFYQIRAVFKRYNDIFSGDSRFNHCKIILYVTPN